MRTAFRALLLTFAVGLLQARAEESPVTATWGGQAKLANGRFIKVTVILRADQSFVEQHRWYASEAAMKKGKAIAEEDRPGTYEKIEDVSLETVSYRRVSGAKLRSGKPSVFANEIKPPCYCVYPKPYVQTLFLGEWVEKKAEVQAPPP